VEHVERQEQREREIRDEADGLERAGDEMQQRGEEVDRQIGEVREEWQGKQRSEDVPGAQEPGGPEGSEPPPEAQIAPGDEDDVTKDTDRASTEEDE
jgi:hypothetical protein